MPSPSLRATPSLGPPPLLQQPRSSKSGARISKGDSHVISWRQVLLRGITTGCQAFPCRSYWYCCSSQRASTSWLIQISSHVVLQMYQRIMMWIPPSLTDILYGWRWLRLRVFSHPIFSLMRRYDSNLVYSMYCLTLFCLLSCSLCGC